MKAGWKTATLGEVCTLIARGVAPKYLEEAGTLVLNQKCVRDHAINYDLGRRHDAVAKRIAPDRLIQVGDVLVNSTGTGTLGRVAQVRSNPPEPTTVDTHVTIVRPKPGEFYPDLFGYALVVLEEKLAASGEGASGQTELARTTVANFEISYPTDLEEQRRIVAVLDEAIAAIATATANAEKNLANARELFEALLRETLADSHGAETCFGEAANIKVGFAFKSSGYTTQVDGVRLVRGDNIVQGQFRWEDVKRWPGDNVAEYADYQLDIGDVLLAMDRTWVKAGLKFTVVGSDDVPSLLVQRVARLRAKQATSADFIALQIASAAFTEYVLDIQTGLGVPHISGKQISDFRFILPERSKQDAIVRRMEEARARCEALRNICKSKLLQLDQLKQSLLHRAFTGELTATMPETIAA